MTERTKELAETRSAEGEIDVRASADRVWQALTDERELIRWFPLDAKVEPGPGGSFYLSWLNEFAATAEIQVWDPPRHLRTGWKFHDEGAAQVTDYYVETKGGRTVVRAVTSGFPLDPAWDGWVEGTNRGWAFELRSLKHYLERHVGEPRHVVYLRRRTPVSNQEAWARLSGEEEFVALAQRRTGIRPASGEPVLRGRERSCGRAVPTLGRAGRAGGPRAGGRALAFGLGRYGRAGGTAQGQMGRGVAAAISRSFSGVRSVRHSHSDSGRAVCDGREDAQRIPDTIWSYRRRGGEPAPY